MRTLVERLIGKSIKSIENGEPGYGIVITFSNGDALTANTEVTACLPDDHSKLVERATITNEKLIMHLSGNGFVAVSVDRDRFPKVVEMFVYGDDEGLVVEN
ncbi:hypothetical protein [Mesorhizobium sp. IMUNJ 23232]|uniref:hypothetical protein n=1 Tax=Mesorhizobium sp. IMUNJ 23232 TaxID=3376064 RepID=UPI0037B066C2